MLCNYITHIMAEEEKEIKKEERKKLPTITIAIVSHGMDLINEKITIDSNVRIYSRAGQALCFGIIGSSNPLGFVNNNLYSSEERLSGEDKRTLWDQARGIGGRLPVYDKIKIARSIYALDILAKIKYYAQKS